LASTHPRRGADAACAHDRQESVDALISDLHWQIDQLIPRAIKNRAGHPYNPSYYKRGLQHAIDRGYVAERRETEKRARIAAATERLRAKGVPRRSELDDALHSRRSL
jgi:hypothetical protein